MKKIKLYRYLGRNGIITSAVLLEGIQYINMYALRADNGMILTNGEKFVKNIDIFAEDLDSWKEIPEEAANNN